MGRYSKSYYKENKEKILIYQRAWKKNNKEKINTRRREYLKQKREEQERIKVLHSASEEDIERNITLHLAGEELDMSLNKLGPVFKDRIYQLILIKRKSKPQKCPNCKNMFISNKKLYCSDKCKIKFWKKNHRKHLNRLYQRHKERMITDEAYAIKTRLRDRLRESIRFYTKTGKIRKAEEYMNYKAIIKHLGPCPGNRNNYHIDHIIPLCKFDFTKDKEIRRAFAPDNLQWLSVKENLKKGKLTDYSS